MGLCRAETSVGPAAADKRHSLVHRGQRLNVRHCRLSDEHTERTNCDLALADVRSDTPLRAQHNIIAGFFTVHCQRQHLSSALFATRQKQLECASTSAILSNVDAVTPQNFNATSAYLAAAINPAGSPSWPVPKLKRASSA